MSRSARIILNQERVVSPAQRRKSYRKSTLIGGQISTGDKSQRVDCRIVDMSAMGARLDLDPNQKLPKRIGLFLDKHGTNVDCEVVWRRANHAGVRFTSRIMEARKPIL